MPHIQSLQGSAARCLCLCKSCILGWNLGAEPDHPGFDVYSAILEFSGLHSFSFGPPNDEKLHKHPLSLLGVRSYGFYEITGEGQIGFRRWVITFHDEALDVTARSVAVLKARVDSEDTKTILDFIP